MAVHTQQLINLITLKFSEITAKIPPTPTPTDDIKEESTYTPPTPQPTTNVIAIKTKPLTAEQIGLFQPDYQDGISRPITSLRKQTIYRDIYVFINRLKDITFKYRKDEVRDLLPKYLRGNDAIIWHTTELSELEHTLLRSTNLEH